ncbi:MAG: EAL domain-containing protein [Pseudomonas sp.]|uniref:bifunctional diguanylate cyclase/phosphodiesterase n=1 Tax=Pseudomonas sp. TaxID=306 RepID=UPI0027349CAC|nr:EAL domain-containing protein [Pseudomonas sp.]MDP3847529.1 EAL domain-containing protein [Pseudomonas sp.]
MTTSKSNLAWFTRHLWLALGMFVVIVASFVVYVRAEQHIQRANEARLQSLLLADELRQSSDDLTRMARTYVVTGEPAYKQHFQAILDIREGKQARPLDYQHWELLPGNAPGASPRGEAVALLELLRQAGLTPAELALLTTAKADSDALTRTEFAAMALLDASNPPTAANRATAIGMLHDTTFQHAKAAIMRPIKQFQQMVDQRTLAAVQVAQTEAARMRLVFALFGALLIGLLWAARHNLHGILGGSVDELHRRIVRLGSGDFSSAMTLATGRDDSVLGWLAATQGKLAEIDAQHQDSEARNQRLTELYAALSQCNQAIVRSTDEAQLLAQVCRVVVDFGAAKMAWIGGLDAQRQQITPLAAFGSGIEHLQGLQISLAVDGPYGRGPSATALRENRPVWCQDFQHDPTSSAWSACAVQFGWGACAALPLHKNGEVYGVLALYAAPVNAFDEGARSLLLEMATDIDYALHGFEHEAQRRRAEAALRESEQRLRTVIETDPECIKIINHKGELLEMNAAGLGMLEADSLEQLQQLDLLDLIVADYREAFNALHARVLSGASGTLEFQVQGLRGTRRWLETHAAPLPDGRGKISMLLAVTRDITVRKQAELRIQHLAHFDALTGLPNRVHLDERATSAIALAQLSQGPVALMFLDIDHFKDINDTLGHSIGDALLIELAQRLRAALRKEDTVSRLGGDEFILLLNGMDADGAAHVAQKLLAVIAAPCQIEQHDLNVSASIGIALYPTDGTDLETLSKNADAAMYHAKQAGRHGYRFFTAQMQVHSTRHLQLANALRQALERDQLQVHYQPQLAIADGRIVGAEALLRWTHPELGAVSPAEFIPTAEDSGLILPIGEWVLRQAVRQAKAWQQAGLAPLIMAVNLSAVQFRHPDLPNLVSRILEEEDLPPEYLELELTEGVAMYDPQGAIAVMNQLHGRGVRMSIDDFGTGYSSLSLLKKFKVYKLKIDQSFVRDISTDAEDRAIVCAIINLAKSLGLQTIAEGVETAGQLAFLREQACDEVQGYYYCKPLSAEQFEQFARAKV